MSPSRAAKACLVALMLLSSPRLCGQERRVSPPLAGATLPDPPQQAKPWTPPKTKLPPELISATGALFDAGLADPRGGEYHVLRIAVGSCWSGDGGVVRTHGWVLPGDKDKTRFAVCWNGLVYPVVSLEGAADVRADIRATVLADKQMRASRKDFYRFRHAWSEGYSISHESLLPLKACLLLRLGEAEMAEELWEAWTAGMRPGTNDDAMHLRDPYLMLATDWAWARFDRALCAHMRGDDRLALLDALALGPMQRAVEAEADKRKLPRRSDGKNEPMPHLDFLSQLAELLADQERRARAKKRTPLPKDADRAQRIKALIEELEDVDARQWSQPGGVSLNMDYRVQALINEGDAAVEPLIRCLETDDRLMRSVGFHRDFFRRRSILHVEDAAREALAGILHADFLGELGNLQGVERRRKFAANVRAYWERFKKVPLEQRWYLLLKDDTAPPQHWVQAAELIAQPTNEGKTRSEPLRKLKDPSVTELLIRRIEDTRKAGAPGSEQYFALHRACDMTFRLAAWDTPASVPVMKNMIKVCREFIANDRSGAASTLGPLIARMTALRQQAGDGDALGEYAEWVRTLDPKSTGHAWQDILKPMWRNSEHAAVKGAAEAMFGTDDSPWTKSFLRTYGTNSLFETPMVGVTAFRKRLLLELTDTQLAGKIKIDSGGYGSLEVFNAFSGGPGMNTSADPLAPKPGSELSFRVCDYHAFYLSRYAGTPRCELYWPLDARNKSVADCIAFLNKYGDRFAYSGPSKVHAHWTGYDRPGLTFARLERPVTAAEERAGRAIFSLGDGEKVRPWKMPAHPMKAKWITYKDYPYIVQFYDPKEKKSGTRIEYSQSGLVWQAEEILKDGKWERYYGFAGSNMVAKVPARELEFPAEDDGWAELGGGIDCRLLRADTKGDGKRVVVRVKLRNRSGLEQMLPREFVRKDSKGGVALHAGINLRLRHTSGKEANTIYAGAPPPDEGPDWQELAPQQTARFKTGQAKTAAPAEEFADFTIDPADWFDLTRPGGYRLQILFSRREGGFADGASQEIQFSLAGASKH